MAASKRFMNWGTTTWTPLGGGTAITIDGVTSVKPDLGGDTERAKGDLDVFARIISMPNQTRTIEVTAQDVAALASIPINVPGTFSTILADARNGIASAGGAVTITLTPCICTKRPIAGDHAKFADSTATFEGYAADGVTDPLTIAAVA